MMKTWQTCGTVGSDDEAKPAGSSYSHELIYRDNWRNWTPARLAQEQGLRAFGYKRPLVTGSYALFMAYSWPITAIHADTRANEAEAKHSRK